MNHDPFFPLLLAAEHRKIEIDPIAVAFARSPMNLANIGHDLNAYSKGRFTLGLGSQIKPHITKRFSMQWGAPAAQMRELVLATCYLGQLVRGHAAGICRRVLSAYIDDAGVHPRGQRIRRPKVVLAAVGPKMTEVAGEVADGMIIHPFSTLPYINSVTLPAIEKGFIGGQDTRRL